MFVPVLWVLLLVQGLGGTANPPQGAQPDTGGTYTIKIVGG